MLEQCASFKISSTKIYCLYAENIPFEDPINNQFFIQTGKQQRKCPSNNFPKSFNDLIKKLINDNEVGVS